MQLSCNSQDVPLVTYYIHRNSAVDVKFYGINCRHIHLHSALLMQSVESQYRRISYYLVTIIQLDLMLMQTTSTCTNLIVCSSSCIKRTERHLAIMMRKGIPKVNSCDGRSISNSVKRHLLQNGHQFGPEIASQMVTEPRNRKFLKPT